VSTVYAVDTLKIVCSVVPGEICREIPARWGNPVLALEDFAVGVEDDLVFSRGLNADPIIHEAFHLSVTSSEAYLLVGWKLKIHNKP
jgi:hypothetical protein